MFNEDDLNMGDALIGGDKDEVADKLGSLSTEEKEKFFTKMADEGIFE